MDADAAGILGLLLGGAGGYYGGKKRAEREASDLEKLIAMYSGKTDEDITGLPSGTNSGLNIGHPGREGQIFFDYPTSLYPQVTTEGVVPTSTEGVDNTNRNLILGALDFLGFNSGGSFNSGGVVPKRGLVDEPGGYAGITDYLNPFKLSLKSVPIQNEILDAAFGGQHSIPDILSYISNMGLFNQGGRVGYEQGGIVDLYKKMNHG